MLSDNLKPIKFHPYRSGILKRIFYSDFTDDIEYLRLSLLDLFNHCGVKCYNDNKIVFECEIHGVKIYYGFYDLKFSIGLGYYDDNERKGGKL